MVQYRKGKATKKALLLLAQCQEDYRRQKELEAFWLSNVHNGEPGSPILQDPEPQLGRE